jgi:hypothetical protein
VFSVKRAVEEVRRFKDISAVQTFRAIVVKQVDPPYPQFLRELAAPRHCPSELVVLYNELFFPRNPSRRVTNARSPFDIMEVRWKPSDTLAES